MEARSTSASDQYWYHLSLGWSDPDAGGNRTVNLFARDLAGGTDLNGGAAILSLVATSAEFDDNPAQWSGIGCRTTRGLVDHIGIMPPGFAAWTATLYPSLAGGLLEFTVPTAGEPAIFIRHRVDVTE